MKHRRQMKLCRFDLAQIFTNAPSLLEKVFLIKANQGSKFRPKLDCESEFFFEINCEAKAKRTPTNSAN